jgi:hypothetical protein
MNFLGFFRNGERCLAFDDFEIDVSLSETHTYESEITKNPVEDGSPISDNIIHKLPRLSINCLCSPLKFRYLGGTLESRKTFIQKKWQELLKIKHSKELLNIFTGLDFYSDMIMTSLTNTRDSSNVNHLEFQVVFEQIRTVQVEYTSIDIKMPKANSKKVNSSKKANGGLKEKKIVEKNESLAVSLFGLFGK